MSSTATFWQRWRRQRVPSDTGACHSLGLYRWRGEGGPATWAAAGLQQHLAQTCVMERTLQLCFTKSTSGAAPYSHGADGCLRGATGFFFFSSPELNFCVDSYSVSVLPALAQWHVKDPDHSAKSAGGRLHLNTSTSFTQRSRSGLTNAAQATWEPIRESNSHETRQGMLGHCRASSLSHCGPIMA